MTTPNDRETVKRYFASEKHLFENGGRSMWGSEQPTEVVRASDYNALLTREAVLREQNKELDTRLRELEGYITEGKVHKENAALHATLAGGRDGHTKGTVNDG